MRDASGRLLNMVDYTGASPQAYWYLFDGHGSVIGLADKNGNQVATYEYDAWGNTTTASGSQTLGNGELLREANPFRYSGYQYDSETGFYYLKSRYYSPELGRFITRDTVPSSNLYAYCENNPVMFIDPSGHVFEILADVVSVGYSTYQLLKNPSWINAGYLLWDLGASALPFIPGSYAGKVGKATRHVDLTLFGKGKFTKLAPDALKTIGTKANSSGIRALNGTADDAYEFFMKQIDSTTLKEVKPGVFIGKDTNGLTFTFRAASKSGPPTIDVNGIKGLRKIKFIGK